MNLRITTIQTALTWEDPAANRAMFSQKMAALKGQTDLIILPEMFTTGFTMNATQFAETPDSTTTKWLAQQAQQLGAAITGTFIIRENDRYYNRLIWMYPDGNYDIYNKRHLFSMANEHLTYTAGNERLIIDYRGWKICPLACYDLRFPVWARNNTDYDILLYVANWPHKRSYAWRTLLHARAIENQAYTIGVNIVGKDGKGITYQGDTMIIEPSGADILYHENNREAVHTTSISYEHLQNIRQKFPFLADRDTFEIKR